jgi:hypothetical protein
MRLLMTLVFGLTFVAGFQASLKADFVLAYGGDPTTNAGATVNELTTNHGLKYAYDQFTVTSPTGWDVDRVWSNDAMKITGVTQAVWEIRTGMSPGNGGTLVASGTSTATQTATGLTGTTVPYPIYDIQVANLFVHLDPGTYWLTVAPVVGSDPVSSGMYDSYQVGTTGTNSVSGFSTSKTGLLNDPSDSLNYISTSDDYSMGLGGSVSAVPEPSSIRMVGLGGTLLASGIGLRAGRARRNRRPE